MIQFSDMPKGATVAGPFVFPKVTTPDFKFDDCGMYKVGLKLDGSEAQTFIEFIDAFYEVALEDKSKDLEAAAHQAGKKFKGVKIAEHNLPYKPSLDEEEDEVPGEYIFNFKQKASGVYGQHHSKSGQTWTRKVSVSDSQNNPVTQEVWGGSVGRIAYSLEPWYTAALGFGVRFKLVGVRVLTLRTGGGADDAASIFGAAEEGFVAEPVTEVTDAVDQAEDSGDDIEF